MTRPQLERILRAAGAISGAPEFVVIGSHALLGAAGSTPQLRFRFSRLIISSSVWQTRSTSRSLRRL